MKYTVKVVNKKNGMNCFIYRSLTLDNLNYILQSLSNLNTDLYYIEVKNEEDNK